MLCSVMWLQNHHSSITMLDSWQEVLYIPVLLAIRPNNPYMFSPFLSVLSWTLALNMITEACKVCDEALGFLLQCLWALHSLTLGEICKDVLSWKHCKVVLTQTWSKMRERERERDAFDHSLINTVSSFVYLIWQIFALDTLPDANHKGFCVTMWNWTRVLIRQMCNLLHYGVPRLGKWLIKQNYYY